MSDTSAPPPGGTPIPTTIGFNVFVGPIYQFDDEGDTSRFGFVAETRHMNSAGAVHGGMLMTIADVAMTRTARASVGGRRCTTVSLNCDFIAAAKEGETVMARVRITRRTRSLVFLTTDVMAGDRLALSATGIWKILDVEPAQ